MRAKVDPTRCEAHGECNDICPSVFVLDDWGYAQTTDPAGHVPAGSEDTARDAADACPEAAITLEE